MITFETLKDLKLTDWELIFAKHLDWSAKNKRTSGVPQWWTSDGTLNVVGVRFNTETDFNNGKYNDFLMLSLEGDSVAYFEVTTDPKSNKFGIAHLRQGCWNSYTIRPHRWENKYFPKIGTIPRWAICQDKDEVEIVRTDGKGNIVETERGFFGINIHESTGDTSLGCTIFKSQQSYLDLALPMLYDLKAKRRVPTNWKNLTYTLINHTNMEDYLREINFI